MTSAPAQVLSYRFWPALRAMLLAWAGGLAGHFLHQIYFSGWGYATDVSAVVFWSGLFVIVSAVTFVPLVTWVYGRLGGPAWGYPLATTTAAMLALWALMLPFNGPGLGLFSMNFGVVAAAIGLLFGVFYLRMNGFGWRPARLAVGMALGLGLLLAGRAALLRHAPVWAYQHLGKAARQELIIEAMSQLQLGDSISRLNARLPGFVSPNTPPTGQLTCHEPGLDYELRFENGRLIGATLSR